MTKKQTAMLVAHELGHAVSALIYDTDCVPSMMEFSGDTFTYATCSFVGDKNKKVKSRYGNLKEVSYLGGIFGELAYSGLWYPWGARDDIENFLIANEKSKHSLVLELDYWMFTDHAKNSFRDCASGRTIKQRRLFTTSLKATEVSTRHLYDCFLDFTSRINVDLFAKSIDEITESGKFKIYKQSINKYTRRIINEA